MFHCRQVRHSYGLDTIYVMPRVVSLSAQKAGTEEARNVSLTARVKHQSRLVDFLPLSVTSATCMGSNTNCISIIIGTFLLAMVRWRRVDFVGTKRNLLFDNGSLCCRIHNASEVYDTCNCQNRDKNSRNRCSVVSQSQNIFFFFRRRRMRSSYVNRNPLPIFLDYTAGD